jgi:hypothetical protein
MRIADRRGQFVLQVNYDFSANLIAVSALSAPKLCKGKRIRSGNGLINVFTSFK